MSAISFAKQAVSVLKNEKPHSSITDLVEILTSPQYDEEAFDGIPELVESINIQPTGAAEASRAIRKKIKHGSIHQQYRALVLLKAAVENGGHKFQTTFADGQLTDAIKHLASDPGTDPKVKKKLISILASWQREFKDEPSMAFIANLYNSVKKSTTTTTTTATHYSTPSQAAVVPIIDRESEYEKRKKEEREAKLAKEEAKRKAKEAKAEEKRKREEEIRKKTQEAPWTTKRRVFDFEKERPQILSSIAETSQAATNLVNALTLLNTEHDSVQENQHVQDCLEKAKAARKRVVRYIQLVENEEMIGTLLETNERIIAALQTYDKLSQPQITNEDIDEVEASLAAANLQSSEVGKLREKQRAAVQRSVRGRGAQDGTSSYVHPDLRDLNFGELGSDQGNLPPPLRPSAPRSADDGSPYGRGSLSDFSDYDSNSSDEDTHYGRQHQHHARGAGSTSKAGGSTSYPRGQGRNLVTLSDNEDTDEYEALSHGKKESVTEDPFADPFAD